MKMSLIHCDCLAKCVPIVWFSCQYFRASIYLPPKVFIHYEKLFLGNMVRMFHVELFGEHVDNLHAFRDPSQDWDILTPSYDQPYKIFANNFTD